MTDIIGFISNAIAVVSRLKDINAKIKEAEFSNLLAELNLDLSNIKAALAGLIVENTQLQQRIRELEQGEPCPRCHKRGWQVESSQPDPVFGDLGSVRRTYRCSFCDFTEDKVITPR